MAPSDCTFLEALARPQPDPGGGAAAALGASVGVALLEKILKVEAGRPGAPPERWLALLSDAQAIAAALGSLREEDGRTYARLSQARSQPKDSAERKAAVEAAVRCPMAIMAQCGRALELIQAAGRHCKRHLLSDLSVSAELMRAASEGCFAIASANLTPSGRHPLEGELKGMRQATFDAFTQAMAALGL